MELLVEDLEIAERKIPNPWPGCRPLAEMVHAPIKNHSR